MEYWDIGILGYWDIGRRKRVISLGVASKNIQYKIGARP